MRIECFIKVHKIKRDLKVDADVRMFKEEGGGGVGV